MPNSAINEALLEALRDANRQIAELRDVLVDEFDDYTDLEGACGSAIRILRAQKAELDAKRASASRR